MDVNINTLEGSAKAQPVSKAKVTCISQTIQQSANCFVMDGFQAFSSIFVNNFQVNKLEHLW